MKWYEKLWESVVKWFERAPAKPAPVPAPAPDPVELPAGATDLIKLGGWTSRGITFSGKPRTWPESGGLSGAAILEIFRDGKWQGGKFEHCRNSMTYRGWENIKNHDSARNQPYGIFKTLRPKAGERARFRLISYNRLQQTNWLESTWK